MGVRRTHLDFEGKFTQVPNAWARDERLSRKARGLLVEIMSHRVGWHVSVSALQKAGIEGRDAIKSGLVELKDAGYLRVSQTRGEQGRFNEVEYELQEPPTASGFSVTGGSAANGSTADGSSASGQSATKNTSPIEDQSEEHGLFSGDGLEVPAAPPATFDEFYFAYPRKVGRAAAQRAFERAAKTTDPAVIVAGARRYAVDPNLPDKQFIPHPSSWLNAGRWDDEAEAAREGDQRPAIAAEDEWMFR